MERRSGEEVFEFEIGDVVEWESQARGSRKKKKGTILVIIPARVDIRKIFPLSADFPRSRRKWDVWATLFDRAIVAVERESGNGCDFYAPRLSVLTKKNNL